MWEHFNKNIFLAKGLQRFLILGLFIFFLASATPLHGEKTDQSFFVFSPDGKYLAKVFLASKNTFVRIHDTGDMKLLTKWQIPGFQAHTIQFSEEDPSQLLIADKKKLLLYHLKDGKQRLTFVKPEISGQEIQQATFDRQSGSILWNTTNRVFKTDMTSKDQKKIREFPFEKKIKSLTSLDKHLVAASFEGEKKIEVFSSEANFPNQTLHGHNAPVIGVLALDGNKLISLDEKDRLIIQDIQSRKMEQQLILKKPSPKSYASGVALDDLKDNVIVIFAQGSKKWGMAYSIRDLEQGKVSATKQSISMTPSGKIYTTFSEDPLKLEQILESTIKAERAHKQTSYELAKIESENGNYNQALEFIRKVKLDDLQYRESRELQKKIFTLIEQKDLLNAAIEQYQRGDNQSAKILLERVQRKGEKSKEAEHYLKLISDHAFKQRLIQLLILLLFLLSTSAVVYYLIKKRSKKKPSSFEAKTKAKQTTPSSEKAENRSQSEKRSQTSALRRSFILLLEECKQLLRKTLKEDKTGKVKQYLDELTSELNRIEKKATTSNEVLPDLMERLRLFQDRIAELCKSESKSKNNSHNNTSSSGKQQSEKGQEQGKKQGSSSPKKIDYYQILDISEKASDLDIKNGYRKRMKEYHPDRHNSTDFDWIKKEAAKMTQVIQEAYEVLSDPQKRKHYDQQQ